MSEVGFVAIGRNEGERLKLCLRSLCRESARVVYVDSGSTDGSDEFARSLGVEVVRLDTSGTFTMSRARNAGWKTLLDRWPETELVHFVDGDCELIEGWVNAALEFLTANPQVAAVCGRRRERFPQKSVFNRLCETEWNTPVGEAKSCGGDSLMRRDALEQAGGFNESLIAGEEPELCLRLRKVGWKIWRIDKDMTRHDADILRWSQWWKRSMRGGYGAADVAARTAGDTSLGEVLFGGQVRSARRWVRGIACALVAAVVAAVAGYWCAGAAIIFLTVGALGVQMARIARGARQRCPDWRSASEYGILTVLAKFPQFLGIRKSERDRRSNTGAKLIEYKT
jgi:glycosyltransferase involved in cell wall biosynthesis